MEAEVVIPELSWSGRVIRDPIYGDIKLSKWEQQLIATPIFRRMRDIHQLGFVYLSYTGANHTRFEHCVGTMEAADRLLKMVDLVNSETPFPKPEEEDWTNIQMRAFRQALRMCALLHDIGHPPYSHTCENLLRENEDLVDEMASEIKQDGWKKLPDKTMKERQIKEGFREDCESLKEILNLEAGEGGSINYRKLRDHETYTKLIVNSEHHGIRDILKKWAQEEWKVFAGEELDGVLKAMVWLAAGKRPPKSVVLTERTKILYPIATFIDGDLDVDKIDYVARDNYHCGFPYELDWSRAKNNVYIEKTGDEESPDYRLAFGRDALFFLTSIIQERYNFGYHLHNETWNTLIERDIVRKLKIFLKDYKYKEYKDKLISKKIVDMHTKWQDGELRFYLQDFEEYLSGYNDRRGTVDSKYTKEWLPPFGKLLAKSLPITKGEEEAQQIGTIREDARIHISFDEMAPPIRKMVHVLREPEMRSDMSSKKYLDRIEANLNKQYAKGERAFVLCFYSVKPLEFTAGLHVKDDAEDGTGVFSILDNQIIRGVMNESLKQFGVCVLGTRDINVGSRGYEVAACENCGMYAGAKALGNEDGEQPNYKLCLRGHSPEQKVLLDQIISSYRDFCREVCAKKLRIIFSDFILKVLWNIKLYRSEQGKDVSVNAATLYNVCREVLDALADKYGKASKDIIFGKARFDEEAASGDPKKPVPNEFRQELRTCVYMGLVDAARDIPVYRGYKPFRRRYLLSVWGKRYFVALEVCNGIGKQNYKAYLEMLYEITRIFEIDLGCDKPEDGAYRRAKRNIGEILNKSDKEAFEHLGKYWKDLEAIEAKKKRAGFPRDPLLEIKRSGTRGRVDSAREIDMGRATSDK